MNHVQIWEYQKENTGEQDFLPMTLSKPGREIVEALGVFHYLTTEQLSRYLGRSLRYIQLHTQRLTQERFIQALVPSKQIRTGSVPYVYTLGRRGRAYLIREGIL